MKGIQALSDEILRQLLAALDEQFGRPVRSLADQLAGFARAPEVALLRQALRAPRDVANTAAALEELRRLADRLRREGLDPAIGIVGLVGDSLEGLDALLATAAVPLSPELQELRRLISRLRRAPVRLDVALPAEAARAAVAGELVRALVAAEPDLAEPPETLAEIAGAVTAATAGAIDRGRTFDPRQPVELHAVVRGDSLFVRIADHGSGDSSAEGWDAARVRRAFDQVSYVSGGPEAGGALELRRRLSLWPWRKPGA